MSRQKACSERGYKYRVKSVSVFGIKDFLIVASIIVLMVYCLVTPVIAQGFFDKKCPKCYGTGKVAWVGTLHLVVLGSQYTYRRINDFTEAWLEVQNQGVGPCNVWVTFEGLYDTKTTEKVKLEPDDIYRFESLLDKLEYEDDEVTYQLDHEKLKVTCPLCHGSGYVTDTGKLGVVSAFVILIAAAVGLTAFAIRRGKKQKS